jgi:uncharacterized protein YggE
VSFQIDTEKFGTLLDEAIQAGATRIDGISFVATDEAIAQAQQQALPYQHYAIAGASLGIPSQTISSSLLWGRYPTYH